MGGDPLSYPAASAGHGLRRQQQGAFLFVTEEDDTLTATIRQTLRASFDVVEEDDVLIAAVSRTLRAALNQVEDPDVLTATLSALTSATGIGFWQIGSTFVVQPSGAQVPKIMGFDGDQPSTGSITDFTFANMPAVAIPGDKLIIAQTRAADVPPGTAPTGTTLKGFLQRLSAEAESNFTVAFYEKTLAAGDITAGKPNTVIETLSGNQLAAALLLRDVGSIQYSLSPMVPGLTATSGFNRTANGAANSIPGVAMTPSGATGQVAVNWLFRGGGARDVTKPSGWTLVGEAENPATGISRRAAAIASKPVLVGVSTGVDNWSVAGAADLTLTAITMLLKP